ncbi:yadA-like C-terminal region family protein [Lysobacter antibioticus]|nr:yadA-like C-terminal region family protein [Lysobacter antibioticus]
MNTLRKNLLAAVLSLVFAPVWAGDTCVLDDGAGGTGTGAATASGTNAVACGQDAKADADFALALGSGADANSTGAIAIGSGTTASGSQSLALGAAATASGANGSALGDSAVASGEFATATGSASSASGLHSSAYGAGSRAEAEHSTALGDNSRASAIGAIAVGDSSDASAQNSVALGANSVADRAGAVSIGTSGFQRQLTNLAAATTDTDAVNLSQLNLLTGAFGGGASVAGGAFTAPTYSIQGSSYRDVGAAFAAVDGRLTDLSGQIAAIPAGPQGPQGPQGPEGPQGSSSQLSASYDDASYASMSLQGASGTRVANVAPGSASTDAANLGQVQDSLRSANAYTDSRVTQALAASTQAVDELRDDMNWRFHQQDRRINQLGAMTSAMVQMSASAAGLGVRNRIAVGAGFQGGERALSIGYQRAISERATVTVGGAFSRSQRSAGLGFGFGW